jgi:nucleoside phosphorylase
MIIATFAAGQPYGTNSATSLASHVKHHFPNLRFGLLVGVAAGLPDLEHSPPRDIRLGDVLVALPDGDYPAILPYGLGKQIGINDLVLLRHGYSLPQTKYIVRSAIGKIKTTEREAKIISGYYKEVIQKAPRFLDPGQEKDYLQSSNTALPVPRERRPDNARTRVWYGSIGSGDKLLKSRQERDKLRDKYHVIGLEMEAAGVMNEIPVGNIRGVCDYGDERKNKDWQPYAAVMAAAYAKAVLSEIPPMIPARLVASELGTLISIHPYIVTAYSFKTSQIKTDPAFRICSSPIQMMTDDGSKRPRAAFSKDLSGGFSITRNIRNGTVARRVRSFGLKVTLERAKQCS